MITWAPHTSTGCSVGSAISPARSCRCAAPASPTPRRGPASSDRARAVTGPVAGNRSSEQGRQPAVHEPIGEEAALDYWRAHREELDALVAQTDRSGFEHSVEPVHGGEVGTLGEPAVGAAEGVGVVARANAGARPRTGPPGGTSSRSTRPSSSTSPHAMPARLSGTGGPVRGTSTA